MHVSMEIFRLGPSSGYGAMEHYISIDAMGQILDVYEQGSECIDSIKAKEALAWDLSTLQWHSKSSWPAGLQRSGHLPLARK